VPEKIDSTLILGHAASGKSLWAEREARRGAAPLTYVATARTWDDEMRVKVDLHAARRGPDWALIEAPLDLASACTGTAPGQTVLIDCATMWLTNLMIDDVDWEVPFTDWLAAMEANPARYLIVSNDVGGGVTPDNAMARRFQRMQGAVNQRLAAFCNRVFWVTAGLPQQLK